LISRIQISQLTRPGWLCLSIRVRGSRGGGIVLLPPLSGLNPVYAPGQGQRRRKRRGLDNLQIRPQ